MGTKGRLFIISGPSGAGKSAVIDLVLREKPKLRYSISFTTRPPRRNEQNGVDYNFISESAFRKKIEAGELAEWAEVHGCLYGTSAAYIEHFLAEGNDVLLDIDVQGAKKLSAKYPNAVLVFIAPPSMEELKRRLNKRGTDSPMDMARRLEGAEAEMEEACHYHYVIINDVLARTVSELDAVIEKARLNG